jgi:hypothetical protein
MPTTEHAPLKTIAFKAIVIDRQAYGVGKQVQGLKIYVTPFSETSLKST